MRRHFTAAFCAFVVASAASLAAAPVFVNGLRLRGDRVDATGKPGANEGRLGFFSDLYYDPQRKEWWAVSDRGPGGGLIDYSTRVQQLDIDLDEKTGAIRKVRGPGGGVMDYATRVQKISLAVHPLTGHISHFHVEKTVPFTDPFRLLSAPTADV